MTRTYQLFAIGTETFTQGVWIRRMLRVRVVAGMDRRFSLEWGLLLKGYEMEWFGYWPGRYQGMSSNSDFILCHAA